MENIIKDLAQRTNNEAEKKFGTTCGWAEALKVHIVVGRKILPIAMYQNRDHGVDPAVVRLDFYEITKGKVCLVKKIEIGEHYKRPAGRSYFVRPTIYACGPNIGVKVVWNKLTGFYPYYGHQYEYKTLYDCDMVFTIT
ncbi:hypothetical protein KKD57_02895 [Patescibacteria group bacterium]|nr:hypothetical protein [Patescibacteria group bacterium]